MIALNHRTPWAALGICRRTFKPLWNWHFSPFPPWYNQEQIEISNVGISDTCLLPQSISWTLFFVFMYFRSLNTPAYRQVTRVTIPVLMTLIENLANCISTCVRRVHLTSQLAESSKTCLQFNYILSHSITYSNVCAICKCNEWRWVGRWKGQWQLQVLSKSCRPYKLMPDLSSEEWKINNICIWPCLAC